MAPGRARATMVAMELGAHPGTRIAADHRQLGADPEAAPALRFGALIRHAEPRPVPARCPLEAALGHDAPCDEGACPFYRVRGLAPACAVEAWSPGVATRRDLAAWYRSRRSRSSKPRRVETPGQAHARRAEACAAAHKRTKAALHDVEVAILRGDRWAASLEERLADSGRNAADLCHRLARAPL